MMRILLTLFVTVFYISAYANEISDNAAPADKDKAGPPQQIIDACKSKADGDSCAFTGPRGKEHEGTCHTLPRNGSLVCIPKPPKIAIDACQNKKEGDSCSFNAPDNNTINGTCLTPPHDKKELACRPSHPTKPDAQKQN
ncbi:MAG: hypothetical protein JSS07_11640 [Proteobacteria bacterium]|nr:hypothetical protein [Pseudomonadota bacterium]